MSYKTTSYYIPFFASLCLFLSAVEYAIPKPLPFMRLGLANLPILISLPILKKKDVIFLIILKVLGQSFISGTLFSFVFLFSASGSLASGFAMLLLYTVFHKTKMISNIGLSLGGALSNNIAQIIIARLIIFGEQTKYIAPLLLITGLVTGCILGVFTNIFCAKSIWYKKLLASDIATIENLNIKKDIAVSNDITKDSKKARIEFIIAMILLLLFLLNEIIIPKNISFSLRVCILWLCVLVFFVMVLIKKKGKAKILPPIFMTFGITLFSLFVPSGKVLFQINSFKITQDALLIGLNKSSILIGMLFLSQFAISPKLDFPGRVGTFLNKMFTVFDSLSSVRLQFKRGKIIETLDSRLEELYI